MSSDAIRALFFDPPVFFPLGLQTESFLAGRIEFSMVCDIAVKGFKINLILLEGFNVLVHLPFNVV